MENSQHQNSGPSFCSYLSFNEKGYHIFPLSILIVLIHYYQEIRVLLCITQLRYNLKTKYLLSLNMGFSKSLLELCKILTIHKCKLIPIWSNQNHNLQALVSNVLHLPIVYFQALNHSVWYYITQGKSKLLEFK